MDTEWELGRRIFLGPYPESPEHCSELENRELSISDSEIGETRISRYITSAGTHDRGRGQLLFQIWRC